MDPALARSLAQVEAHAAAAAALVSEAVPVGAFTAYFARDPDGPSYAVPRAASEDALEDLAALRRLFGDRGLPLRVELAVLAWPEVVPALVSTGLEPREETPLFVCTPESFRPAGDGALVRWVDPAEDLVFVGSVMRQGMELRGGPPSAEDVAGLRAALTGPVRLALATAGVSPAGTGFSTPLGATTELSAVSVLPTQRRQGVAAALVTFLLSQHHAAGGDVAWACTGDAAAAGLLYKVGFRDAGVRVSFSD